MFFNNIRLPSVFDKLYVGDYPLTVLLADKGKIGFIDQCMSIYRINYLGLSEQQIIASDYEKRKKSFSSEIYVSDYLNKYTNSKYKKYFGQRQFDALYTYLHFIFKNHRNKFVKELSHTLLKFNILFLVKFSVKKVIKLFKK